MELTFPDGARAFLREAGAHLAADPVRSTVVATNAGRLARDEEAGRPVPADAWWLVVRQGAEVVGAGMRTATDGHRPAYLLPMPLPAATAVARTVHDRGEVLRAANGAREPVEAWARETARLVGGTVHEEQHVRLFEARAVVAPPAPSGELRAATEADLDLVEEWFGAFHEAADEQAGRTTAPVQLLSRADVAQRVADGVVFLWVDGDRPVSLTGRNLPAAGVVRIGPVYTPPDLRGRGYAGASVAALAQDTLHAGHRVCLFTDQANPVSNRIYQRIGFEPVVDMLALTVRPARRAAGGRVHEESP